MGSSTCLAHFESIRQSTALEPAQQVKQSNATTTSTTISLLNACTHTQQQWYTTLYMSTQSKPMFFSKLKIFGLVPALQLNNNHMTNNWCPLTPIQSSDQHALVKHTLTTRTHTLIHTLTHTTKPLIEQSQRGHKEAFG